MTRLPGLPAMVLISLITSSILSCAVSGRFRRSFAGLTSVAKITHCTIANKRKTEDMTKSQENPCFLHVPPTPPPQYHIIGWSFVNQTPHGPMGKRISSLSLGTLVYSPPPRRDINRLFLSSEESTDSPKKQ